MIMDFRNCFYVMTICIVTATVFIIEIKGLMFVSDCPTELTEVVEASQRLECDNDKYGNNQYMCVPNKDKTSLVEFCYDGIMGIQKEGYCLQVSGNGKVIEHSCLNFSSGCPERTFWKFEFYKYQECLNINKHHHCYVRDPSCPLQELTTNTYMSYCTACDKTPLVIVVIILSSFLVTTTILLFIVLCWKLKKTKESTDQTRKNNANYNLIQKKSKKIHGKKKWKKTNLSV